MNRRKLEKLRRELESLRRSPAKAIAFQSLATRLGRRVVNRGKHPIWESVEFSGLFPLAIPDHGGRDLSTGVRNSVLNQLEGDILAWDNKLSEEGDIGEDDGED
jgi:hypothetical protein